jgi:hypothetical protein
MNERMKRKRSEKTTFEILTCTAKERFDRCDFEGAGRMFRLAEVFEPEILITIN